MLRCTQVKDYKDWRPFLDPDPDGMVDVTPESERMRRVSWYETAQNAARSSRSRWMKRAWRLALVALIAIVATFAIPAGWPTTTSAIIFGYSFFAGGYALVRAWMAHIEIGQPAEL